MLRIVLAVLLVIAILPLGAHAAPQQAEKQQFVPKKVEVDTNYDGKIDRVETYDANGQIQRIEIDSTGKGVMDEWIVYKNGNPVRKEKDSNGDGKADVWIQY